MANPTYAPPPRLCNLLTATPGELADALGDADTLVQDTLRHMEAIERELRRRGLDRAAGARYAVVLGDGGVFILDMTLIAAALEPEPGDGGAAARPLDGEGRGYA